MMDAGWLPVCPCLDAICNCETGENGKALRGISGEGVLLA